MNRTYKLMFSLLRNKSSAVNISNSQESGITNSPLSSAIHFQLSF